MAECESSAHIQVFYIETQDTGLKEFPAQGAPAAHLQARSAIILITGELAQSGHSQLSS